MFGFLKAIIIVLLSVGGLLEMKFQVQTISA